MLLDFLFPKRCIVCKSYGEYLCADCFAKLSFETYVICLVCGSGSIDGLTHPRCRTRYAIDGVFCGVSYNGIAKKLVYVFKYQPYLSDTKQVLVDLLYESLIQKELFMQAFSATSELIPIPLSTGKHRQRGYNQAKLLADGLAKKLQVPVADILQRRKETIPQFGLTKLQRKENVKDAFAVKQIAVLSLFSFVKYEKRQYRNLD